MNRTLLLLVIAACGSASTAPTAQTSRGLRADQHLSEARDRGDHAAELGRWPDHRSDEIPTGAGNELISQEASLWYRPIDQPGEQAKLAAVHRSEAAALHVAFEQACENIPSDQIRRSPLQRHGTGGSSTEDGVVIYLDDDAGTADRLAAELRCHRAWLMLSANGVGDSPLDLPDIEIEARNDETGAVIAISADNPRLVPELQRRAARELELAGRTSI